jgi:hypothetical protein
MSFACLELEESRGGNYMIDSRKSNHVGVHVSAAARLLWENGVVDPM